MLIEILCVLVLWTKLASALSKTAIKISALIDLATKLDEIFIPTKFFISLLCQKGQFTLQTCLRRLFIWKNIWLLPQKVVIENSF